MEDVLRPLPDRVAAFVRTHPSGVTSPEVQSEFADVDPAEVRAALRSLSKSHLLDVRTSGGEVLYRATEHKPETQPGSALSKPRARHTPVNLREAAAPDEDDCIAETPPLAGDAGGPTAKESEMPRGIYPRKPREPKQKAEAADNKQRQTPEAAPAQRRKRAAPRRAKPLPVPAARPGLVARPDRFEVSLDLRAGAVTIHAQKGSLSLAPDEVLAFLAFLGRRPA